MVGENGSRRNGAVSEHRRVPLEAMHPAALEMVRFLAECLQDGRVVTDVEMKRVGREVCQLMDLGRDALADYYNCRGGLQEYLSEMGISTDRLYRISSLLVAK